jgi:hypothetical protein
MKLHPVESAVRSGVQGFADTLPVDAESDWPKVIDRSRHHTHEPRVVAWPRLQQQHSPRRSYRRPALLAIVAVAVVAAATLAVLTLGTGPAAGTPALPEPLPFTHGSHQTAVALLQRAAGLRSVAPASGGPIRYAKTQNYALQAQIAHRSSTTTVETTAREVWAAAKGSALAKSALQDTTRAGTLVGPPTSPSSDNQWQDVNRDLPTEATALRAALLGSGATGDETDLILAQVIMGHLAAGTANAAQTASLYRMLATLPAVFDAGTVTDDAGRSGEAVGIITGYFDAGSSCTTVSGTSASITNILARKHALGEGITYLVLDPATGDPLQIETVDTPNPPCGLGLPTGATIEQYNLILKTGTVNAIGDPMP